MSTSEIAKLESRWRENRQGLTFAPLAEAYRKMGEHARALEVLGEGLAVNPTYIPASIVLGRVHLDMGNDAGAESAFARVLELDGENVIALRALADLAERQHRLAEARERLASLLSVDRGNDEARAQLAALEARLASGENEASVPLAEPRAGSLPGDSAWDAAESSDEAGLIEEPVAEAPPSPVADWIMAEEPPAPEPVEPDPSIQLQEHVPPPEPVAPLDDLMTDDRPAISAGTIEPQPMDGLVGQDFSEHGASVVPLEDLRSGEAGLNSLEDLADIDRQSDLELSPSDTNEYQVADASLELAASITDDGDAGWGSALADETETEVPEPIETVAASFGSDALGRDETEPPDEPAEATDEPDFTDVPEPEPAVADDTAWEDEETPDAGAPELVVTESMAELYLRQGHRKEALAVYRLLYQRSPDDFRLRERLDALETELASAPPSGAAPAPVVSLAAREPGRTVAAMLQQILRSKPPEPASEWQGAVAPPARPLAADLTAPEPSAAQPTRPAGDHLSLSDVFGEEGSPVPPAVPAAAGRDDELSFDAFFGDSAGDQARARAPARDDDDLDQFQTWLQNLKR